MKRVRGVDEVTPIGVTQKLSGSVSGVGVNSNNLEYHTSGIVSGVTSGQSVRPLASKEMPGSIQFGTTQTQQQYAGAIVVPAAATPVKVNKSFKVSTKIPKPR